MKRTLSLFFLGLLSFFTGAQTIQHGTGNCCAECQLIKEENQIELVEEKKEDER
jgi:hypothetical protein